MSDLSQRIMDAWLAVNPEPNVRDDPSWTPWREKEYHLQYMLACGAYESAVMQFLVPEGWHIGTLTDRDENDEAACCLTQNCEPCRDIVGTGNDRNEALLNAIEAIEQ